jgi:formylglycine-generating enzyme required for sulfatase activity
MQTPEALLKSIGSALLDALGADLATSNDKLAEALPGVARGVWKFWAKERTESQRHAEVGSLIQRAGDRRRLATAEIVADIPVENASDLIPASVGETHVATAALAEELALGRPEPVQEALTAYLEQVPASVRQWLRRPSDPTGMTVPSPLAWRRAEDLLAVLPLRVARFREADTPLPGTGWQLAELLGVNQYSETWKASQPDDPDGPTVVLKFFTEPWAARILRNDASLIDRVMVHGKHPHVVPLRQIYLSADPPCLEYDYVVAGNLVGMLQEWEQIRRRPNHAQIAQIVQRLAKTMAFAHRLVPPLVHRALKPANILVNHSSDGRLSFRVTDFGCGSVAAAQAVREAIKGSSGPEQRAAALRGGCTALCASPQALHGADPSPRDDVYSLGMIWYLLLTGDLTSGPPRDDIWKDYFLKQDMTEGLVNLLAACLAENPEERPRDAAALANQLGSALQSEPDSSAVAHPAGEPTPMQARRVINSVGVQLAIIPAGIFKMGSVPSEPERGDDEGPQHEVKLTKGFYMGVHSVTQRQFELVMGHNPSYFQSAKGGGPDFPVENVSWEEAVDFCTRLMELPAEKEAGRSYRLPTEAEWEYACRAGQPTPFNSGLTISSREANFNGNYPYGQASRGPYLERTSRVGSYPPNSFGLYDMHGNVWEWCADYYDRQFYRHSPRFDPQGPASGTLRVVRGGSCYNIGRFCRSAYRFGIAPANRDLDVGFRVVMEISG